MQTHTEAHTMLARSAILWLVAALTTIIGGAIHLRHELQHGGLALPPTYDDVSYLLDGARYLHALDTLGPIGALNMFVAAPPHAPISTMSAFAGLMIFGLHNWVGAVANVVVLFFLSRLFLHTVRSLPLILSTALLVVLWSSPFIGLTVRWFRPDMFASIAIAGGCLFVLSRHAWVEDKRAWLVSGIALGLALWAKPAIFPLTLSMFAIAVVLVSVGPTLNGRLQVALQAGSTVLGTGLILAFPYYSLNFSTVVKYIYDVVLGVEADIWVQPLPFWESVTAYLTGYYGLISLGWWVYAAPIILISHAALLAFLGDKTGLGIAGRIAIFLVITYSAVTIPTFKGPHGYPFAATVTIVAILSLSAMMRRVPLATRPGLAVAVVGVSLGLFQWPFTVAHRYVTDFEKQSRRATVDAIIDTFGDDLAFRNVLFSTSTSYTNAHTIEFGLRERGLDVPRWNILHRVSDFSQHEAALYDADFVVAYSPEMNDVIPNLPTSSAAERQRFIDAAQESAVFGTPTPVPDPMSDGSILIFKKLPAVTTFGASEAFEPTFTFGSQYEMARPSFERSPHSLSLTVSFRRVGAPLPGETIFVHLLDAEGEIIRQFDRMLCERCPPAASDQAWSERFMLSNESLQDVRSIGIGLYSPTSGAAPLTIHGSDAAVQTDWNGSRMRLSLPSG